MQVTSSFLVLLLPWLLAGPEWKELRQVTYPEDSQFTQSSWTVSAKRPVVRGSSTWHGF